MSCPRSLPLVLALVLAGCAQPKPGQRWVKDVRIQGCETLDEDDVLDGLETHKTGWLPWADKQWYDPAALDMDIQRIEAFYAARGLFDARVTGKKVSKGTKKPTVIINLSVREGPPTRVTHVLTEGLEKVEPALSGELTRWHKLAVGRRFNHKVYTRAKRKMQRRLREEGYAYAQVGGRVEVHRRRRTAKVIFVAKPGPRVRFGRITVKGNGDIPADKILNLITFSPGDLYDPMALRRSRALLFSQRVFAVVRFDLPKKPTAEADVVVQVAPTKLKELRLGLGVGFERQWHEVRLSAKWTWRNFLGGMRTLEASVRPAFVSVATFWDAERIGPAVEAQLKLTQPDIFGSKLSVYGLVGYDLEMHPGYQFHGPRAQLGLERAFFSDILRAGLSWNLQYLHFFNIVEGEAGKSSLARVLDFKNPYRLAWLEPLVMLDLRDARMDTRSGFFAEARMELGSNYFGGEFSYLKVVPDVRAYIPLGTKRLILALRGQLGYMKPFDDPDDIGTPLTRRLKLGGPTSHRGFTYGRLSPQEISCQAGAKDATSGACRCPAGAASCEIEDRYDRGIPLGGDGALLLSADLRWRVVKLAGAWFSLAAFFDAGDVTRHFSDLDMGDLHLASGGSLQYDTPIGKVRLAIGVRLNRMEPSEAGSNGADPLMLVNPDPGKAPIDRMAFHLTLGEAF